MTETIQHFFEACHPFGYPLLACSLFMVSAIFYHILFSGHGMQLRRWEGIVAGAPDAATAKQRLKDACATTPHKAIASTLLFALDHAGDPTLEKQLEARLREYMDSERCGMTTIHVISNISPMLGILGTAWGLVSIFAAFGSSGAEAAMAQGISKALYTTIFGLAIAVPGIIALALFERGLEMKAARLNRFFSEVLSLISHD